MTTKKEKKTGVARESTKKSFSKTKFMRWLAKQKEPPTAGCQVKNFDFGGIKSTVKVLKVSEDNRGCLLAVKILGDIGAGLDYQKGDIVFGEWDSSSASLDERLVVKRNMIN